MRVLRTIARSLAERRGRGTVTRAVERSAEIFSERLYDLWNGVDTSGQNPFAEIAPPGAAPGRGYRGTASQFLRRRLRELDIAPADSTFVDFGSGKGRTLLVAAEFPFRHIAGIEISPGLHRIAQANVAARGLTGRIACHCLDAAGYVPPDDPLVLFFFNPFGEDMLGRVVDNLRESFRRKPRSIRIIYRKPLWTYSLDTAEFLLRTGIFHNTLMPDYTYCLYREKSA